MKAWRKGECLKIRKTVTVPASSTLVISDVGLMIVACGANTKVQANVGGSWYDVSAAGDFAFIISDGQTFRLNNAASSDQNSYLFIYN